VEHYTQAFIGIDVAKLRNAIAIAEGERGGEVRFVGEVDASDDSMRRIIRRIAAKYDRVHFCYEAGPTGYGLHRLIMALGFDCMVVAPSLIPRKPGDRVKNNRRDAVGLARLLRAGELTAVWVPDEGHEAMRDLVRARAAAVETLRVHRQQVSALMLRHGRHFARKTTWGGGCRSRSSIIQRTKSCCRKVSRPFGLARSGWNGSSKILRRSYRPGRWRLSSVHCRRYEGST